MKPKIKIDHSAVAGAIAGGLRWAVEKLWRTSMTANSSQVGGDHYSKHGDLQHWDVVHHFKLDYFQGQITKYVMRWKDKGGVQDLEKARHFLEKYIELQKKVIADTIKPDPIPAYPTAMPKPGTYPEENE